VDEGERGMGDAPPTGSNKVPQVTFLFWVIKIAATTLGETGGDAVSMGLGLGYGRSSLLFLGFFAAAVTTQLGATAFSPWLYWTVILATTVDGTTMADFADRSLGIGYTGGSLALAALLIMALAAWRLTVGTVSVAHIRSRQTETFYWVTILLSNTLGTALGDGFADDSGLGFDGGAALFATLLLLLGLLYRFTAISRVLLFWLTFVLTRPLGATLGDLLTKPHSHGGLNLSRAGSSAVLLAFVMVCIVASNRTRSAD
jgi:uncharacterized membrane-anchored protein